MSVFSYADGNLPEYCEPANAFLFNFSSTFHTCIPTNVAFVSTLLGTLSIIAWLFAQLPQIYKNYTLRSSSGLSIIFLSEWLLGDVSNLLGCVFTQQALWQVIIACYYVFVDCCLCGQWLWYEHLQHGRPLRRAWWPVRGAGGRRDSGGDMQQVLEGVSITPVEDRHAPSKPAEEGSKPIHLPIPRGTGMGMFRMPKFSFTNSPSKEDDSRLSTSSSSRTINRIGGNGNSPMPSPKTVLYISLLLAVVARASPVAVHIPTSPDTPTPSSSPSSAIDTAGTILSWLSTLLYLCSRLPQLYKNHLRRSTSGLSPVLFVAAFFGNSFYTLSITTNPCAWGSYPPHGLGGWVGHDGNDRQTWIRRAAPFWLGAAGVLVMDAAVGFQFLAYGDGTEGGDAVAPVIVVEDDGEGTRRTWRRVSGWLRGWVPSVSIAGTPRPGTPADARASPLSRASQSIFIGYMTPFSEVTEVMPHDPAC
ncbi:hypothetical protein K402DRAFT_448313 [Aulographum hederae CBS 113979]|uniref:PQ-loop-domain-containing protein n=1 Tax=Aulographum hederae CBS 113979 TaxID=1176131 RepID=A0A6G1GQC3_9PEZI|nr:hypothetical protein K402DRAFT_448313 [Aulographum hederae CBS 113979]